MECINHITTDDGSEIRQWQLQGGPRSTKRSLSYVTVIVIEALVLRPLLEDWGRITESIRILVPIDETEMFSDHDETSLSIATLCNSHTINSKLLGNVPLGCKNLLQMSPRLNPLLWAKTAGKSSLTNNNTYMEEWEWHQVTNQAKQGDSRRQH